MEDKQQWYTIRMNTSEQNKLMLIRWGLVQEVMVFGSEREAVEFIKSLPERAAAKCSVVRVSE